VLSKFLLLSLLCLPAVAGACTLTQSGTTLTVHSGKSNCLSEPERAAALGASLKAAIAAHNARTDQAQPVSGDAANASRIRREKLTNITQMRKQAEFLSSPKVPQTYYGLKR